MTPSTLVIDAHCHVSDVWFEPAEALLAQMDRCGVARAVLIQLLGQYDNAYQQAWCDRHPDRFASVVAVDPQRPDAARALRGLAEAGARGLRLRPTARSSGPDPLAIWRCAADLGLSISCVGNSAQFADPQFAELVAALPSLPIVLEHLAGQSRPDADAAEAAQRRTAFELARYANVSLKLPGLGELAARRPQLPASGCAVDEGAAAALVEAALRAFGPERLLWASDFPVVASREGYANALAGCRAVMAGRSSAEQALIFGGNAERLYFDSI